MVDTLEDVLVKDLVELLGEKDMTCDQLASCYSIKHGRSVTQALKELSSYGLPLHEFLARHDVFMAENGKVRAVAVCAKPAEMKYADVSRGIQNIFKERKAPLQVPALEVLFEQRFGGRIAEIVGMPTVEYLVRKSNIFEYTEENDTVYLQPSVLAGPPLVDPSVARDEKFVVDEFERLIEDGGPVVYISSLCGKFIQRNGCSVSSITKARPLDLFKRNPDRFMLVGGGHVTLKKFAEYPEVRNLVNAKNAKQQRAGQKPDKEDEEAVPENPTEQDIVDEFRRLILKDNTGTVYISSLCGRFLQRFKKPVTGIIEGRPADFLRKYDDIFIMLGGGNVGLREVLGEDAVSVPPPPPRERKREEETLEPPLNDELVNKIVLTDECYQDVHNLICDRQKCESAIHQTRILGEVLERNSFLAVQEVVLSGATGKGIAINTSTESDLVVFVRQLPLVNHSKWLPHILETLQAVLEINMTHHKAQSFKVERNMVNFVHDGHEVRIFVSPQYPIKEQLWESIANTPPAERYHFEPAFVKDALRVISNQPQSTKAVIRLIKWWASQQKWSCPFTTPSSYLLELVVVHACEQLPTAGLCDMVSHIMQLFSQFDSIKVVWDEHIAAYPPTEIWRALLAQEPLFMHPFNPYVNLADPNFFDCRELIKFAKAPDSLHLFRREASKLPRLANMLQSLQVGA